MAMTRTNIISTIVGFGLGWVMLTCVLFNKQVQTIVVEKIIGVEYITNLDFTEERLIEYLKEINVKYPHIVLAQAQFETGHYKSKIFKENKNLFGLKEAKQRATTSKGTKLGHAHFNTWKESVLDYSLLQCKYMSKLSEEEYYAYLAKNYAEDPNYIIKIRKQANKNKSYFNE